jgi:hypothetical protein
MSDEFYESTVDVEIKKEGWMNSTWRPAMAWSYMIVCMCDFVVFPVLWTLAQMMYGGQVSMQWSPITISAGGLYHLAMGAILGVTAFGRTKEKLAGVNNDNVIVQRQTHETPSNFNQSTVRPVPRPPVYTPSRPRDTDD